MYQPNPLTATSFGELARWLGRELARIAQEFAVGKDVLAMTYLTALPAKPLAGLYLFDAGVAGASRGCYRYDPATLAYTFLA